MQAIPVVVLGLGPIGRGILAAAHHEPSLRVVGAVDSAPALRGQRLDGLEPGLTIEGEVAPSLEHLVFSGRGAVVLQATGSHLLGVAPQLEAALDRSWSVVSTCEELSHPFVRHRDLASRLHHRALEAGCTLVATGVNPGLMMDRLPSLMAAACRDIRAIRVERVQDPSPRRDPFRRKVGYRIPRREYDRLAAAGTFGHVGLRESALLLASALNWVVHDWEEHTEAVQPDPQGLVLGTRQILHGRTSDGRQLTLRFEAHGAVGGDYDAIVIDGTPPVDLRIDGGVQGDEATVGAVMQAARVLPSAPRGLITVLDLPLRRRR